MDFGNLTDTELAALIEAASARLAQRQSVEAVRQQMGGAITEARQGGVLGAPARAADWVEPADVIDAYVRGDVLTHEGQVWVLDRGSCIGPPSTVRGWHVLEGGGDDDVVR